MIWRKEDVNTFVVRLWAERGKTPRRTVKCRGSLEHVQSGKKQYFEGLEKLLELIQQQVGENE